MGILRIDCGIIDVWWQSVWGDSDIVMYISLRSLLHDMGTHKH